MNARLRAGGIVAKRLYRDYLQPTRLDDIRALIHCALERRYETMTLSAFAQSTTARERPDRVLLLRHDVDSDVPRARRMWELEQELGVVGSYFFRRSTWDIGLMRELASAGYEVGYHYEELATLVKERGAANAEEARALIPDARARLQTSLAELRADSGLALDVLAGDFGVNGIPTLDVLASHGDFANRVVGVANVELLADSAFRADIGVRLEAYDVEGKVDARSSDGVTLTYWWPADPMEAFQRGERVVEVLLHPRAWGAAPIVNARLDLLRVREGCLYRLRRARNRT